MTAKAPEKLERFCFRALELFLVVGNPLLQKSALNDSLGPALSIPRTPGLKNPNGYHLPSKGPDKTEGTDDDIGNWQ